MTQFVVLYTLNDLLKNTLQRHSSEHFLKPIRSPWKRRQLRRRPSKQNSKTSPQKRNGFLSFKMNTKGIIALF